MNELFRRTVEYIVAHPDHWDQGTWLGTPAISPDDGSGTYTREARYVDADISALEGCGTVACMAGVAALLSNDVMLLGPFEDEITTIGNGSGSISRVMSSLLGVDEQAFFVSCYPYRLEELHYQARHERSPEAIKNFFTALHDEYKT